MAYIQPQKNLNARWLSDGGALFVLMNQGREYERRVKPNELVTIIEAAALLQVSRSAPYLWINRKRNGLRAQKVRWTEGREVYAIRLSDLSRFAVENGLMGQ